MQFRAAKSPHICKSESYICPHCIFCHIRYLPSVADVDNDYIFDRSLARSLPSSFLRPAIFISSDEPGISSWTLN